MYSPPRRQVREGENALLFSNCSSSLSCCLLSFAHFANSSWLLVEFISVRTFRNWLFNSLCSAADCGDAKLM